MFGIGFTEILLILIVGLIVIGPEKLPELAKTIGKAFNEFKRTTNDIKRTIEGKPSPPSGANEEEEKEVEEIPKKRTVKPPESQKKKSAKKTQKNSPKKSKGEGES